jgi:hypothetical protein
VNRESDFRAIATPLTALERTVQELRVVQGLLVKAEHERDKLRERLRIKTKELQQTRRALVDTNEALMRSEGPQ